jgi:endogenous inhibitor of DNA gyrase (YacG/DUF329 family)
MKTPSCPTCKAALSEGQDTPAFPFCSQRCKLADLGNWLDGRYAVAQSAAPDVFGSETDMPSDEELIALAAAAAAAGRLRS